MNPSTLDVELIHGAGCCWDLARWLPPGRVLSPARQQYLHASEWVVVSRASAPVGFAAYRCADGEIRVVHELLLDHSLELSEARMVTEALVATLEMQALDDGIACLTFLLPNGVITDPFQARGYSSLVLDSTRIWLQRKLGWAGWCGGKSGVQQ
jgi:hypothetical protein